MGVVAKADGVTYRALDVRGGRRLWRFSTEGFGGPSISGLGDDAVGILVIGIPDDYAFAHDLAIGIVHR